MPKPLLRTWLALFVLLPFVALAQRPPNDDCANAQVLTIGPGPVSGTTVGSTYEPRLGYAFSDVCAGELGVWYTFVGTGALTTIVSVGTTNDYDHAMSIFTAASGCGSLYTQLACKDVAGPGGTETHTFQANAFTTYYVYIATRGFNLSLAETGPFTIDVNLVSPAPPNDDCGEAIAVPMGTSVSGSLVTATNSSLLGGCAFNPATFHRFDDDLWYSFVTPGSSVEIATSNQAGSTDLIYEVFSGSCGALTSFACSNPENFTVFGLTAGTTYYLRVATYSLTPVTQADFTLTLTAPPPPPVNDVCTGATAAMIGAPGSCPAGVGATSENFLGVTPSGKNASCGFSGFFDRWYTWTATSTSFVFTPSAGSPRLAIYSGTCGVLTQVGCLGTGAGTVPSLTVGVNYYLQVWSDVKVTTATPLSWCWEAGPACATPTNVAVSAVTSTTARVNFTGFVSGGYVIEYGPTGFTLGSGSTVAAALGGAVTLTGLSPATSYSVYVRANCNGVNTAAVNFTTAPTPPQNDECSGATSITVNGAAVAGTTVNATSSTNLSSCSFAFAFDDDVWFSFVATTGMATLSTSDVSGNGDRSYEVYSGVCGNLTSILCSDPEGFPIPGLTAGQTYLIRVASRSTDPAVRSTFTVTLTSPPPPPLNDDCAGATILTMDGPSVASTTNYATGSADNAQCGGGLGFDDDVWFRFIATVPTVEVVTSAQSGSTTDLLYEVYSGTCSSLMYRSCETVGSFRLIGLVVGQPYTIRVATTPLDAGIRANFSLAVSTSTFVPFNDDCVTALKLFTPGGSPTAANGAVYSTASATISYPGSPQCGGYNMGDDDDIWFRIDPLPVGTTITITAVGASDCDPAINLYSGECGSLAQLDCSILPFGEGTTATITFTTALVGGVSVPYHFKVFDQRDRGSMTLTVTQSSPLPVSLTRFSARADGARNVIEWAAASEVDLATYTVERATDADATHFKTVASVAPRGTTSGVEAIYSAFDESPARVSYYRLRAVDLDGTVDYSDLVALTRSLVGTGAPGIRVFPNPSRAGAAASLALTGVDEAEGVEITIRDAAGRELARVRYATDGSYEIPVGSLPVGVYTVAAVSTSGTYAQRFVIH